MSHLCVTIDSHAPCRSLFYKVLPGECASPLRPCQTAVGSLVAVVIRAVVYGIYIIWHFVLVWQGSSDMARMPVNPFRSVCCTLCFEQLLICVWQDCLSSTSLVVPDCCTHPCLTNCVGLCCNMNASCRLPADTVIMSAR